MFMIINILLVFSATFTTACFPSHVKNDDEYCSTPECEKIARAYAASINKNMDPCEDFYSYVCHGWKERHRIPPRKSHWDMFDKLYFDVLEQLHESLEYLNLPTTEIGRKLQRLYKGCMDEIRREIIGVEPLKEILRKIGNWPILGHRLNDDYDWMHSLAWITKNLAVSSFIINIYISPDKKNTTKYILYVDQTSLGIGMNELLNISSEDRYFYNETILNVAYQLYTEKDTNTVINEINEMIEFESTLASFCKSIVERRNKEGLYNKMTLRELQQLFGKNVNIIAHLQEVFEGIFEVKDDMEVVVPVPEYVKKLGELIGKTSQKVVANYIGWRVVRRLSSFTTKTFRDSRFTLINEPIGSEKEKPLHEYCISTIDILLEYALGSIYIRDHFSPNIKPDIFKMVKEIKYAFKDIIKESKWIDDETKAAALLKLYHMKPIVGFPSWILDDTKINNYYEMLGNITEENFFKSVVTVLQFLSKKELMLLNASVDRNIDYSWIGSPVVVNAYYNANANGLFLSAGILQFPFYQYGLPAYINFGSLGNVIGHEMTHAFDDEGGSFDEYGNLRNWWSPTVKKKFMNKSECFINQYGNYEPVNGLKLDGRNTLGENIADNGGVREAFRAYKRYLKEHGNYNNKKLPYLDEYTREQLFFISYAYVWCSNEYDEVFEQAVNYDPHSPSKFRVLGTLSNNKEFHEAFNCIPGDKMYKQDKCLLW